MRAVVLVRPLAVACLLGLPLAACVSGPSNPSASRASELANTVSRALACRAGSPRRDTLDRFLASESQRGATPEHIASARSTYITVSEAQTINQGIRPEACDREERAALRERMNGIRAGRFEGL
ncbi:MAG: hypothetical protein K2Z25_03625 [Beijerinckiaceae bacterium]|nr:hypothetical protein [Beijerinckiaceae bacterium]